MRRTFIAGAFALGATAALAATWFDATPSIVQNVLLHWLNGSNVATPVSAANPLPVTVSGGGGSNSVTVSNVNPNGAATAPNSSPVTPSNQPVGAAAFSYSHVSVSGTATLIVAARTGVSGVGRIQVLITNTTTTPIYIGDSGVATTTGILLPGSVGATTSLSTTAALYGIVASGSATVTEMETY